MLYPSVCFAHTASREHAVSIAFIIGRCEITLERFDHLCASPPLFVFLRQAEQPSYVRVAESICSKTSILDVAIISKSLIVNGE